MADFSPEIRDDYLETRTKLTVKSREYLENLPTTLIIDDLFTLVHGSPRHPVWEYIFSPITAQPNFNHFATLYCLVGHTHEPVSYQESLNQETLPEVLVPIGERNSIKFNDPIKLGERRLIINPGGVGGGQRHHNFHHSYYIILDTEAYIFSFRRIPLVDNPYVQLIKRRNERQRSLPNCQPIPPKIPPPSPPKEEIKSFNPSPQTIPLSVGPANIWSYIELQKQPENPVEEEIPPRNWWWPPPKFLAPVANLIPYRPKVRILIGSKLQPGKKRYDRQSCTVARFQTVSEVQPIAVLAVVADSMIGPSISGINISDIVTTTLVETFTQVQSVSIGTVFTQAFETATQRIINQSSDMARGLCVAALIMAGRLYIATIGYCKIYLLRHQDLRQISVDDNWAQLLFDLDKITPDEFHRSHSGHPFDLPRVTSWLGDDSESTPNFRLRLNLSESRQQSEANQGLRLYPGDQILLSSGRENLTLEQIRQVLLRYENPQKAVDKLVSLSLPTDNDNDLTFVLLKVV